MRKENIILKFTLKEKIDSKKFKDKKFFLNNQLLQINEDIYFLNIEKLIVTKNFKKNNYEYILEIEFSHLKNYFFRCEKFKQSFIRYLCKKIIFSFFELRSRNLKSTKNSLCNLSYNFYFSDHEIILFD